MDNIEVKQQPVETPHLLRKSLSVFSETLNERISSHMRQSEQEGSNKMLPHVNLDNKL